MYNITWPANSNISIVNATLFSHVSGTKNANINSITAAIKNKNDNEILNPSLICETPSIYSNNVLTMITPLFKLILNGLYDENINPINKLSNKIIPPITNVRFFILYKF